MRRFITIISLPLLCVISNAQSDEEVINDVIFQLFSPFHDTILLDKEADPISFEYDSASFRSNTGFYIFEEIRFNIIKMTVIFPDTNYYSFEADTNTFIVSENAKSGEVTLPTSTKNPKPETISFQRFSDETMEIIYFNSGSINAGITRSEWRFAVDSGLVEVNQSFIAAHIQTYYSCNLDSLQIIN